MDCRFCDETFDDEDALHAHWWEAHRDELNSHDRDTAKRAANKQADDAAAGRSLRMMGKAATAVLFLVAAGLVLGQSGLVDVDTGSLLGGGHGDDHGSHHDVGPAGSTHVHVPATLQVNDRTIRFTDPKFFLLDDKVHFERPADGRIHIHATGVTLGYLFSTLDSGLAQEWHIGNDSITVSGDTYVDGQGANVTVLADGEPVDNPPELVLNDISRLKIRVDGRPQDGA